VTRAWVGAGVVALLLCGGPTAGRAQVFLSSEPHPEFAIGPLFIVGTIRPDLGPVAVRVSWSVTLPPGGSAQDIGAALYLLWPGEVAEATAPGAPDPALGRHVEERGFTVINRGRLALETRDRTKLGTLAQGTPLPEAASFVTFYKTGTNAAQSGIGTFVRIPWTPLLADPVSLMSFTMAIKDAIAPKPATWTEELFWGRRHTVSLSAGSAGSLALYSLYFDQRDRVIRLARDFSLLAVSFTDADHLRVEEINPASATRRPSRVRAGGETVSLPIAAAEGTMPQTLKVQFSYFSGPVAWRPIVISVILLIIGNLMGAFMFAQEVRRFFRTRFHLQARPRRRLSNHGAVPAAEALVRIVPGRTTRDEVLQICGPPAEEREQHQSTTARSLIYRGVQRLPHHRFRLGRLATVSHWDEEHSEVEIALDDERVTAVQIRVRRFRLA
jgi:hypothetical protein